MYDSMMKLIKLFDARHAIMCMAICDKTGRLIAGLDNGSLRVWNLDPDRDDHITYVDSSGAKDAPVQATEGNYVEVNLLHAATDPRTEDLVGCLAIDDKNMLLAVGIDSQITLFDMGSWLCVQNFEVRVCEFLHYCTF